MTTTYLATSPVPRQGVQAKAVPPIRAATQPTKNVPSAVMLRDNLLYRTTYCQASAVNTSRSVANLNKPTISQLLATEKKSPDYAWFKPARKPILSDTDWPAVGGAGRLMEAYYRYPAPEPLLLTAGVQPVALLPERCMGKSSIDTSPLVEAAKRKAEKETDVLVKIPASADCSSAAPLVTQLPAEARVWAGRSPTPGLPETINLAEIIGKKNAHPEHPEWLIGPVERWNKVQA